MPVGRAGLGCRLCTVAVAMVIIVVMRGGRAQGGGIGRGIGKRFGRFRGGDAGIVPPHNYENFGVKLEPLESDEAHERAQQAHANDPNALSWLDDVGGGGDKPKREKASDEDTSLTDLPEGAEYGPALYPKRHAKEVEKRQKELDRTALEEKGLTVDEALMHPDKLMTFDDILLNPWTCLRCKWEKNRKMQCLNCGLKLEGSNLEDLINMFQANDNKRDHIPNWHTKGFKNYDVVTVWNPKLRIHQKGMIIGFNKEDDTFDVAMIVEDEMDVDKIDAWLRFHVPRGDLNPHDDINRLSNEEKMSLLNMTKEELKRPSDKYQMDIDKGLMGLESNLTKYFKRRFDHYEKRANMGVERHYPHNRYEYQLDDDQSTKEFLKAAEDRDREFEKQALENAANEDRSGIASANSVSGLFGGLTKRLDDPDIEEKEFKAEEANARIRDEKEIREETQKISAGASISLFARHDPDQSNPPPTSIVPYEDPNPDGNSGIRNPSETPEVSRSSKSGIRTGIKGLDEMLREEMEKKNKKDDITRYIQALSDDVSGSQGSNEGEGEDKSMKPTKEEMKLIEYDYEDGFLVPIRPIEQQLEEIRSKSYKRMIKSKERMLEDYDPRSKEEKLRIKRERLQQKKDKYGLLNEVDRNHEDTSVEYKMIKLTLDENGAAGFDFDGTMYGWHVTKINQNPGQKYLLVGDTIIGFGNPPQSIIGRAHESQLSLWEEASAGFDDPMNPFAVFVEIKRKKNDLFQDSGVKYSIHNLRGGESSVGGLRSPICCVMGHVDTGKTKLLDKMRRTHVQEQEAGGITQQIGATFFPISTIRDQTKDLYRFLNQTMAAKIPGLLIIDTPGHESFANLRARGSNLCDIAILVIDIMHGIEPQTIESIRLLKAKRTPFIVALNKIDRVNNWNSTKNLSFRLSLQNQPPEAKSDFNTRVAHVIAQLGAEAELNTQLYYKNKDFRKYVSIVPTSASTGEGISDLMMLLIQLTQKYQGKKIGVKDHLECSVLDVKKSESLGNTLDVVLVNGELREGDSIVLCGLYGPIQTTVKVLMTPKPLRESRVHNDFVVHKHVKASAGIRIAAPGLEDAVAGTSLLVVDPSNETAVNEARSIVQSELTSILERVKPKTTGVFVHASTLGSLEAILHFFNTSDIPVAFAGIGPIGKNQMLQASTMFEQKPYNSYPERRVILAFDVKVSEEAKEMAEQAKIPVFTADIIYHLQERFKNHVDSIKKTLREEAESKIVFPVVLNILPDFVFRKKSPIVLGVKVVEGSLKVGTPLLALKTLESQVFIGKVVGLEVDKKERNEAHIGEEVCIRIEQHAKEHQVLYGRQFDHKNQLVSRVSSQSIEALVENYKETLSEGDYALINKLRRVLRIRTSYT
ncbi:hypothetical protein AAMO2058_000898500 [Amorphochlora amoebiformis]